MVCRSDGSNEGVGQNLNFPLQTGTCYVFSMDLARSDDYYGYNRPAQVRIWGGENRCEKKEFLWTSPAIEHVAWKKYVIQLSPRKAYVYLVIEVYYNG
jgi:hypothetical protein